VKISHCLWPGELKITWFTFCYKSFTVKRHPCLHSITLNKTWQEWSLGCPLSKLWLGVSSFKIVSWGDLFQNCVWQPHPTFKIAAVTKSRTFFNCQLLLTEFFFISIFLRFFTKITYFTPKYLFLKIIFMYIFSIIWFVVSTTRLTRLNEFTLSSSIYISSL
jgi:hypothetical protein